MKEKYDLAATPFHGEILCVRRGMFIERNSHISHKSLSIKVCEVYFQEIGNYYTIFACKTHLFSIDKIFRLRFYSIPAKTRLSRYVFVCTCRNGHEKTEI